LRLRQPSTLRIVIWPEASKAQNNIAAVSAEGSTVWVLIRRLNSSCNRSIAFEVRIDFHWLFGKQVKANNAFQPFLVTHAVHARAQYLYLSRLLRRLLVVQLRPGFGLLNCVFENFCDREFSKSRRIVFRTATCCWSRSSPWKAA